MALIRPFRGLRFAGSGQALTELVAPPYDVLSPAQRDALAAQSPHNVVHLTLPEKKSDDRSKYVKYARSAAALAEWRRQNVLKLEEAPVFYRYTQRFTIPGDSQLERTALIALIKTEPYEKGVVLPHEQTFPKHKEDRLRILEATRAHLECIFGLYEDPDGSVHHAITPAPVTETIELTADDVFHRLEPISDPSTLAKLEAMFADKKVWIADGHHRYETACTFRESLGEATGLIPEDFMMMALTSMADPGLVLLPTHRILSKLPYSTGEVISRLSDLFAVDQVPSDDLVRGLEAGKESGRRVFGLAMPEGQSFLLTAKGPIEIDGEASQDLKSLDVTVLHKVIFEQTLGILGLDTIGYTRDANEAIATVEQGAAAAFLMSPPSVDDMRTIALGGEKMPQKSTYYYPKILSGLVLWSLGDFDA
jgi:uncharacterized protein (DUF1015 family)